MLEERDARIAVLEAENAGLRECARTTEATLDSLNLDHTDVLYRVIEDLIGINRRAAAAYPTHSEGGDADKTGRADECGPRLHITQPLSDQRSAAATSPASPSPSALTEEGVTEEMASNIKS